MKILFTQFTPPFVQIHSSLGNRKTNAEQKYLDYSDWYSNLRRLSAQEHTVKFISFTNQKKQFSIFHDGYESIFFPVINPKEKVRDGRWDFIAPGLVEWVKKFNPHVIHLIGTGHLMAHEILNAGMANRSCVWVRTKLNLKNIWWEELHLCKYIFFATAKAAKDLEKHFPNQTLLSLPFGANITTFKPVQSIEKKFDVMSVGYTTNKQAHIVKSITKENGLSWLLAGGINKGWPFRAWEDILFFSSKRKKLRLPRIKKARYYPHMCGFFDNSIMPDLYNQSKVFVHPALAEGAPRCVQEALACEVPVVVLKNTVPYVLPEFGIACETHEQFEDAVLSLLADEKRRKRMGKNGREWLIENHSPEKLYEAVSNLNSKLVSMDN